MIDHSYFLFNFSGRKRAFITNYRVGRSFSIILQIFFLKGSGLLRPWIPTPLIAKCHPWLPLPILIIPYQPCRNQSLANNWKIELLRYFMCPVLSSPVAGHRANLALVIPFHVFSQRHWDNSFSDTDIQDDCHCKTIFCQQAVNKEQYHLAETRSFGVPWFGWR